MSWLARLGDTQPGTIILDIVKKYSEVFLDEGRINMLPQRGRWFARSTPADLAGAAARARPDCERPNFKPGYAPAGPTSASRMTLGYAKAMLQGSHGVVRRRELSLEGLIPGPEGFPPASAPRIDASIGKRCDLTR